MASALLSSDNSVFQQLTLDVGPDKVIQTAYDMGIPETRELPDVASIGLGSGEVTPLDMATAYAPLSNGGFRVEPLAISQDRAARTATRTSFAPERERAFSDGVAYEVTRILQNNVTGGTGTRAQIGVPVAGKTGTTEDFVDAWFVGYTPEYSTAVWVGYPNADGVKRSCTSVHGIAVAGGSFPAQIWGDFMRVVVEREGDSGSFPLPSNPVDLVAVLQRLHPRGRRGQLELLGRVVRVDRIDALDRGPHHGTAAARPRARPSSPGPTPPPTTVAPVAPPTPTPRSRRRRRRPHRRPRRRRRRRPPPRPRRRLRRRHSAPGSGSAPGRARIGARGRRVSPQVMTADRERVIDHIRRAARAGGSPAGRRRSSPG